MMWFVVYCSEMFRCLLFFVNEALVEEPQPDTPLQVEYCKSTYVQHRSTTTALTLIFLCYLCVQFPHLKGAWAESMLVSVYQKYCRSSGTEKIIVLSHLFWFSLYTVCVWVWVGYMSLEEFVEFMEDSAILNVCILIPITHCTVLCCAVNCRHIPHAACRSVDACSPRRQRRAAAGVPGSAGPCEATDDGPEEPRLFSVMHVLDTYAHSYYIYMYICMSSHSSDRSEMESALSANDSFCLNFAQFYQLLLRISHVVYPELHHEQPCIAMNKLLQVHDITTVIDYIRIVLRGISHVTINRIVVSYVLIPLPLPSYRKAYCLSTPGRKGTPRGAAWTSWSRRSEWSSSWPHMRPIFGRCDQRVFGISCYLWI